MLIYDLHTIGHTILQHRKRCGLTQEELAEAAGLSPRAYADIERGSVSPRLDSFMRICAALQITPNDILITSDISPQLLRDEIVDKIKEIPENKLEQICQILNSLLQLS